MFAYFLKRRVWNWRTILICLNSRKVSFGWTDITFISTAWLLIILIWGLVIDKFKYLKLKYYKIILFHAFNQRIIIDSPIIISYLLFLRLFSSPYLYPTYALKINQLAFLRFASRNLQLKYLFGWMNLKF